MAGIDDVLERLLTDTSFAHLLARDPASALDGYSLSQDDLKLLSTQVSFDPGALSLVEERISKAGVFGLLTSFTAGLGGLSDLGGGQSGDPHMLPDQHLEGVVAPVDSPGVIGPTDSQGVIGPSDLGETHGIIGPVDSPGVIGPTDSQGVIGPSDLGETHGIIINGAGEDVAHGTGGGAGSEVSIKEVDPAPQPGAEGGGGAGQVNPGVLRGFDPQPDPPGVTTGLHPGEAVGFNPQPDPPGIGDKAGIGDKLGAGEIIIND